MAPLALLLAAALRSPLLAAAADVGLRAQYFSNAVLLEPACTATEPSPAALRLDAKALAARCGGKLSPELFSSRSSLLLTQHSFPIVRVPQNRTCKKQF